MALSIPNVLVAGTDGVAADLNDNFDAVEAYVNTLITTADLTTSELGKLSGKLTDPVQLTSNSAVFTTPIADIAGFAITFTAVASRMYKLEVYAHVSSASAGDWVALRLRTSGGTTIQSTATECPVANEEQSVYMMAFVTPGAGAVTYKVSGERLSGAGNCMVEAAATYPAIISVQDFGAD